LVGASLIILACLQKINILIIGNRYDKIPSWYLSQGVSLFFLVLGLIFILIEVIVLIGQFPFHVVLITDLSAVFVGTPFYYLVTRRFPIGLEFLASLLLFGVAA
jgi:hypothetical protein